jgi:ligand-binding sensor domain-containing protein
LLIFRINIYYSADPKYGNIWVATEGGIYIYDPRFERFERFNLVTENGEQIEGWISDFVQDADGDLWISIDAEGVFHLNLETKKMIFYSIPTLPGGMSMISLCAGNNNEMWVFPYGLPIVRIDKESGRKSEFQLIDDPTFFSDLGEVHNALADENNQLLVPTSNKGLVIINTVSRTHRVLLESDLEGKPIFARTVKKIDNQTLWIGSESGIYIVNTFDGTVENLRHDHSIPTSLSDNAVYSIYQDRDGGIWIGSFFGGVDYYSKESSKFELFYPIPSVNKMLGSRVREFYPAGNGHLWIGTEDNGLHLFDPTNKLFLPLPEELRSLYTNIHALYDDGESFWISTFSKGLNRYHKKSGELTTYVQSDTSSSISHNSVFAMCRDRQNVLWIGTLSGLNTYNYETDSFTRVDQIKVGAIHDIFEDSDGNIWVATYSNGLYQYFSGTGEWRNYRFEPDNDKSLSYNTVTSVFEDSKNRLWITTQGGGFCLFNKEDETFTTYNTTNGLPNDVVYQIQEDNEGYLWLSTNGGLVRYNPQGGSFRNYTVDNGLKTNQFIQVSQVANLPILVHKS